MYMLLREDNSGGLYSDYHKFFYEGNRLLKWKTNWVLLSFSEGYVCNLHWIFFKGNHSEFLLEGNPKQL